MDKSKIIFCGTFSFPNGQAASARVLHMARGYLDLVDDVQVICCFGPPDCNIKRPNYVEIEGKSIKYKIGAHFEFHGTSLLKRIKNRFNQFASQRFVLSELKKELKGTDQEVVFVYGRSRVFINALFRLKKQNSWKTRIIFDLVEPPHTSTSIYSYLAHPFAVDSKLVYRENVLRKFDLILFITSSLKNKYGKYAKSKLVIPSIQYISEDSIVSEKEVINEKVCRIAYLGSLISKDNPELLLKLCEHLIGLKKNIELHVVGRFELFEEGRLWKNKFRDVLKGNVHFHMNPDEEKKNQMLSNFDLLVLFRFPDEVQRDTFPTRCVEMLKLGKPLLINMFGDFSRYFRPNENCFEIDPNNLPSNEQWDEWMKSEHRDQVIEGGHLLLMTEFNARKNMEAVHREIFSSCN